MCFDYPTIVLYSSGVTVEYHTYYGMLWTWTIFILLLQRLIVIQVINLLVKYLYRDCKRTRQKVSTIFLYYLYKHVLVYTNITNKILTGYDTLRFLNCNTLSYLYSLISFSMDHFITNKILTGCDTWT